MAELDGLWTIAFEVAGDWRSGGVVLFEDGRLSGGDSFYFYYGHCREQRGILKGEARIIHHSGPLSTGFGDSPDFVVVIEAQRRGDIINGHIFKPKNEEARLKLRCVRRVRAEDLK
ncbi:MAG TPA: GrlR family regulatory protein [Stellaceae bacterium]|nr:GrlR family regulatory protein [Stellaceae bacterium]